MRAPLIALVGVAVLGCRPDIEPDKNPKGNNPGNTSSWVRTMDLTTRTGADGSAYVDIDVEKGDSDMLITLTTDDGLVYFREVFGADGSLIFDGNKQWSLPNSLSYAYWPDVTASFNWPILANHQLPEGRYTVRVAVDDDNYRPVENAEVRLQAQFSDDPSFDSGDLSVNVVFTGGTEGDPAVQAAVDEAIRQWGAIYNKVQVNTTFQTSVFGTAELFQPPSYGTWDLYEQLMAGNEMGTLNLVVVPEFTGAGGSWTLGLAGGIPGSLVPTGNAAVAVNVGAHWGNDMKFSEDEQRIFAETMAHEVGHYLGLFHPVEDGWNAWDSVNDTPECNNRNDCEGQLGPNLMFPYTVCNGSSCTPQDTLTEGQKAIMQRFVGIY